MAEEKKVEKADKNKKPRKNPFKAIVSFFKSVNSERKKVVWPNAKETLKNTAIVLVVTVIVGVAIYAVDTALSAGMELIRNAVPERTTISETVDDEDAADDEDAKGEDAEDKEAEDKDAEDEATTGDTAEDAADDGEDE